jgi:hypothetical protein
MCVGLAELLAAPQRCPENDNRLSALYRYVTNLYDSGERFDDFGPLQIAAVVYSKKLDELRDDRRARLAAYRALVEWLESRSAQPTVSFGK